jgi:alpha-tubulin suppressor-like RCC1 family protein
VTTSGSGYCWGLNASGVVGDGTVVNRLIPTPIAGGLQLASISVGFDHGCAVTTGGEVYCWGENAAGQVGDDSTTDRTTPVRVIIPEQDS